MAGDNQNSAGSVGVEIYGDLDRLTADFAEGKARAEKFYKQTDTIRKKSYLDLLADQKAAEAQAKKNKGANDAAAKAERDNQRALMELTKAYQPAAHAALKFEAALKKIQATQRAGLIGPKTAASMAKAAEKEFMAAAKGTQGIAKWAGKARSAIFSLQTAFVALGGVAIAHAVTQSLEFAKAIKDNADQVGISTDAWQKWSYIAKDAGVGTGELMTGMEGLQRSMGRASTGARRESELFRQLGIDLKDSSGKAKDINAILPELADRLELVGDKNQRAAALQILFGESASRMGKLLEGGSEKINGLAEAAEHLGIILSDEQIQKADQTAKKLDDVKTVLSAQIAGVVADNADSILALASALATLAEWAGKAGGAYVGFWNKVGSYAGKGLGTAAAYGSYLTGIGHKPAQDTRANSPFNQFGGLPTGPAPGAGTISLTGLNAPKGRTRDPHRERAYEQQMGQLEAQIIRGMLSLATNADARAQLETRLLDIEHDTFTETLRIDVQKGKYTKTEAKLLSGKFEELDVQKRNMIELQRQEQIAKDRTQLQSTELQDDLEVAGIQKDLARSRKEQLDLSMQMLDTQTEIERLALQQVIDSQTASDIDKAIAREKLAQLDIIKGYKQEQLQQQYQGPVADLFQRLNLSSLQLADRFDQIRADKLQAKIDQSVQMAANIGDAFANLAGDLASFKNPLQAFGNFITSLAQTFTENVIMKPVQEWATRAIGGPLAEMATGAPAGPEGLWIHQLGNKSLEASFKIDAMAMAATRFAQGFSAGMGGGGGGGILGSVLNIASSALVPGIGANFSPSASLVSDVNANILANPGIFDDGGMVGPGGRPIRRKPSNVDITAEVGEYIIPPGPSRKFRRELDMIRTGRTPNFRGVGGMRGGGGSVNVSIGDLHFPDASDERGVRRAVRQAASDLGGRVARAAKTGIVRND